MRNSQVLSIDFGSAYTKLAVRMGWDDEAVLIRDTPVASRDSAFCIPSVVACVERSGKEEWLIGAAAANQLPGKGIRVYRNWKAGLFSEKTLSQDGGGGLALGSDCSGEECVQIGVRFFRALRKSLSQMPFDEEVTGLPVRVCIPRLGEGNSGEQRITVILKEAGWQVGSPRPAVYEPESNALGVLSRGRNATWIPLPMDFMPWRGRSVHLRDMLEPSGLNTAFRQMRDCYGVLVVDIGAFTTDFGYVRFDSSFRTDDWNRPTIIQRSYELGINELDRSVLQELRPEAREAIRTSSAGDWDSHKITLYKGDDVAFRNPRGGVLVIGQGDEGKAIKKALRQFADRVDQARMDFYEKARPDAIDAVHFTGGGAMIDLVRQVLTKRVEQEGVSRVYDLLDEEEARRTIRSRKGHADAGAIEARARQNQELVRGGSAIGGCSVFFE